MEAAKEITLMCMLDAQGLGEEAANDPGAVNPYPLNQPGLRNEWRFGRQLGIAAKKNDMINAKRGMM